MEGGDYSALQSSISVPQNSTAASGTPLPPGTVNYQNTWNNSQALACPVITQPSQPLVPVIGNNWTLQASIPTLLLMNKPISGVVNQTYHAFSNGTTTVTDSRGNSFGWTLTEGLSNVIQSAVFVSNSSEAIQNITFVSSAHLPLGNFEIMYSLKRQSCNQAGLEVSISGAVNWGAGQTGIISFHFSKEPIQMNGTTAWFGNNSETLLGFDWSATKQLKPTFQNISNYLSYVVGSNFSIDPTVITSLSSHLRSFQ